VLTMGSSLRNLTGMQQFYRTIIQKKAVDYLSFIMSCDLGSKYFYNISNRLPSDGFTTELDTNTNNFLNVFKNSKSFLSISIGTRRSGPKKKNRNKNLVTLSFEARISFEIHSFILLHISFHFTTLQIVYRLP
jgi:hypothetical protein